MKTNGELIEGIFVGNTSEEVAQMLRSNQSYPISIQEHKQIGSKEIVISKRVGAKDLSFFCRQLHAMLNAGSTVIRCLEIMKVQIDNKNLREAVSQMHSDVQKGKLLSLAMKEHQKIFPDLMIYMVESGELSGNLDNILLRLADYFEKDAKIRNKIKSAMIYPIILIILSNLVVLFLVTFIMPTFVNMFDKSNIVMPLPTRILLGFSKFLRGNALLVAVGTIILILLLIQFLQSEVGKRLVDGLKLKLPIIRKLNIKILTARFARNLSTLLSSGVPLLTALDNVSRVIGNKIVAEAINKYREEIQKGHELHQVVRDSNLFPPMLDNMMEIGKESGALDTILGKTADYYDDESEQALQRLVSLFEPIMIVVMAVVIGFIVIAMALPMFDMVNTIE